MLLIAALPSLAADFLVYAGTHTSHGSKGIYAWRFQSVTGKLTPLGVAAETGNPSFLVEHPNHRFLYAVNENGGQNVLGSVSAFAIDAYRGRLTPLNWVSSQGGAPCHLAIDGSGRWLAVANCTGGVAVLPILPDGRLGDAVASDQPGGSHTHNVLFSPDNRFLLAADPGLGRIRTYRFDAGRGTVAASGSFAAAADRLAFHPGGVVLYALAEDSSRLTVFRYDASTAGLREMQTASSLPEGFAGPNQADGLGVNRAGTVLYVSDSGPNSLAQFAIDSEKFTLIPMEYPPVMGRAPRQFALDPTGGYLFSANQESNNITVFRVHPHTGQLQPAAAVGKNVPNPSCILFVPLSR